MRMQGLQYKCPFNMDAYTASDKVLPCSLVIGTAWPCETDYLHVYVDTCLVM